jgi:cytoskeletal protein RodZ
MTMAESQGLRGFDSFTMRLGDELRGERASMGKSLLDVQRELRIKAAHIDAIENADPAGIAHVGYVCGYVRSYARYLGLDEDETLRRFCEESGFEPQTSPLRARRAAGRAAGAAAARGDLDAVIAGSRLAAISRTETINGELGATLRGLGSLAVLATIVVGLGYGGLTVLENIQRVDFSPLPEAPTALASVPGLDQDIGLGEAPLAAIPDPDMTAIAAVYAAQEVIPPTVDQRDGPISTINPAGAGVYARSAAAATVAGRPGGARAEPAVAQRPAMPALDALAAAPVAPSLEEAIVMASAAATPADDSAPAPISATVGVVLVIADEAWLRVTDGGGATVYEALMQPDSRWEAPADLSGLTLRAGNAAGVFIEVDGVTFGPVGGRGEVISGVSLDAEKVRDRFGPRDTPLTTSALDGVAPTPR